MADIRRIYGGHTADRRLTDGGYTADIRWIYGRHTPEIRPKTDSKFFVMNWLCGRYLQLICGWHTSNMRLIYGQKLILRIWLYGYHSCFFVWWAIFQFSAVYLAYVSRMFALCQPSVSGGTAVCQPYLISQFADFIITNSGHKWNQKVLFLDGFLGGIKIVV